MRAKPPISEELAAFLECGLSITMATRDGDLEPNGTSALAARVHEERTHVTVYVHSNSAQAMLRNLERYPEIAVLFDLPSSHRACQAKGRFTASHKALTSERRDVARQVEAFRADLEGIGIARALTAQWKAWPCVAFEFRVEQIFEQTPGPGTGGPLK